MAAIILPQPWTRQPQYPVGINRAHPYGNKVSYANLAGPVVADAIKGGSGITAGSFTYDVNQSGRALKFNGSTNYATTTLTANASQRTYIAIVQRNGDGGGSLGRVFDKLTVSVTNEILLNESTANCYQYQRAFSTTNGQWQFPRAAAGTVEIIGITYDSSSTSNNPRVWVNGSEQTVTVLTTPIGSASNNTDGYVLGNRATDFARAWDGLISTFVVIDDIVTAKTMSELTQNPWQLFAPLPRRIFVGPSAGGAYTLTANAGSYALNGQSATLTKTYEITASNGSYTLTGQTADLTYAAAGSYTLTALAGSYTLTGQSADLLKSNVIVASNGSYSLTGQTATLTYAAANAYVLTAQAGSYALNGQNATLTNSGEVITAATPQVGIDWGALVQKTWGKEYAKPEYQYEFSNGRRFLEKKNPYS